MSLKIKDTKIEKWISRWISYRQICLYSLSIGLLATSLFVFMDAAWWKNINMNIPFGNILSRIFLGVGSIYCLFLGSIKIDKNWKKIKFEVLSVVILFTLASAVIIYDTWIRNGYDFEMRISNLTPMCIIGIIIVLCIPEMFSYIMLTLYSIESAIALVIINYSRIKEDILAQILFIAALYLMSFIFDKQYDKEFEIEKKLERMAWFDQLTGLYNRNYITEKKFANPEKIKAIIAVAMVDIDFFKRFNDNYGHQTGDEVLQMVAEAIKNSVRKDDISIRWGGEEILILFMNKPHNNGMFNLNEICERIRKMVNNITLPVNDHISVSIGATFNTTNDSLDTLVKKADTALYCSKNNGRNQIYIL